jgi:putative nucleotidyltransferase with HDIG domain
MIIDAEAIVIRKRLEQSLKEIPPLPVAVTKVLDEANQAEPDMLKIDEYISSDHALTAKVLRIVNSAYYGLSRQVTSVNAAVMILGIQQVKTITLSVGSLSAFSKNAVDGDIIKRFWEHSFAASATCQSIGSKIGLDRKAQETLATSGILHDMGRMFLCCNFKTHYDQFVEQAKTDGITYEQAESDFLGDNHAAIGAMIAEKWGLPDTIVNAIKQHEGPFDVEVSPIVAVLHLSDWMNKGCYYDDKTFPIGELDPNIVKVIGLSEDSISQIRETVRNKVAEASAVYGMAA